MPFFITKFPLHDSSFFSGNFFTAKKYFNIHKDFAQFHMLSALASHQRNPFKNNSIFKYFLCVQSEATRHLFDMEEKNKSIFYVGISNFSVSFYLLKVVRVPKFRDFSVKDIVKIQETKLKISRGIMRSLIFFV